MNSEFDLDYLVAEAIGYLRANEPPEGYFVGFSGGKDSIVTLELCRMAGVKYQAWHSLTGIDPPEVVHFIHKNYPEMHYARPETPFYTTIVKLMPPMRMVRWCCNDLKKFPTQNIPLRYRLMGIRAEESSRRAARGRESTFNVGKLVQTTFKPIFYWKEWAVWDFIDGMSLPYPSIYDEGFPRVGCVVCPFSFGCSEAAMMRIHVSQKRWPGIWRAFRDACKKWYNRKAPMKYFSTFGDWWHFYLFGQSTERYNANRMLYLRRFYGID